ncbi:MAG: 3-deoxy-manno-octulosonate cytidylyltransferase [Pseudomonadota bacterium]
MIIVIPARYASTRLPGKPLADVAGKPLIERVYERAKEAGAERIVIATDDERIADAAGRFRAQVCLTSTAHASGTDRLAEVIQRLGIPADTIVVNLQGDEPLMPPALIREVAEKLAAHPDASVATACHPVEDPYEFGNPNVVKVVMDAAGYALYFSRAPIPWPRERMAAGKTDRPVEAFRHIGLYAYRAGFVKEFAAWPPCPPEQTEQLEQLRVLWHGRKIIVHVSDELPAPGVDTPEDLERVRKLFSDTARR